MLCTIFLTNGLSLPGVPCVPGGFRQARPTLRLQFARCWLELLLTVLVLEVCMALVPYSMRSTLLLLYAYTLLADWCFMITLAVISTGRQANFCQMQFCLYHSFEFHSVLMVVPHLSITTAEFYCGEAFSHT